MSSPFDYLILGAGYLARALHTLLPATSRVCSVRRTAVGAGAMSAGTRVEMACDVAAADAPARLAARLGRFTGTAFFLVPPSGLGQGDDAGALVSLAAWLATNGARRVVVASSTGVYADSGASEVDQSTVPLAGSARTRRLLAVERVWSAAGLSCVAVRLAGLYGPGRVIGRRAVSAGEAIGGDPQAWLNLVHVEDAARALFAAATCTATPAALVISDGTPLRRADYYEALARELGAPAPRFDGSAVPRGSGSRRCLPQASWQHLGCAPGYPCALAALPGVLAASATPG